MEGASKKEEGINGCQESEEGENMTSLKEFMNILDTNEKKEQFKIIRDSSLKTALFMILEWVPFLVQLFFIGQIKDENITGGFGMGLVWSNCFAVGLFGGLGAGVETLASFTFGAKKYKMTGIIFQRGAAITTVAMIPVMFLMWNSDIIINTVSGKEDLGNNASIYCRLGIPAFYFSGLYNIFKGFLTAQNEYHIPLITVSITTVASIFWNWLFISYLDLGITGAAIARNFTEGMNITIVIYLVIREKIHERCPIAISKLAFKEWGNFLKFAIPIGSLLTLEWISYELFTFQASRFSPAASAAHVIMNNVNTVYFQFGYGVSIAITTFVGNEMGARNISKAQIYSKQGLFIAIIFLIVTQIPFSYMEDSFVQFFTLSLDTQNELRKMFTLYQWCMILDTFLACMCGVTRGIGKQNFAAASFIFSYLIVGQVISYTLGFELEFELKGVWIGIIFGILVTTAAQVWCAGFSDWKILLEIIQTNIQNDEKRTNELLMQEKDIDEEIDIPLSKNQLISTETNQLADNLNHNNTEMIFMKQKQETSH